MTQQPGDHVVARPVAEHPLDSALRSLGPQSTAQQRLEVVWSSYERANDSKIGRPPKDPERVAVLAWLRRPHDPGDWPALLARRPSLTPLLHRTVAEKAWNITQLGCRVHSPDEAPAPPYAVTFPVGIEPWSAQSRLEKVALREAVSRALQMQNTQVMPWGDSSLCLTITALVSRASVRKDVDNLVKGLLDAMQGYLYVNDDQVQCLTVRRMEYAGARGHYLVHAVSVPDWSHDVVMNDPAPPHLANGQVEWPPK